MTTNTTEPDLVEEVEELLASWRPSEIVKQPEQVRELLRRLVEAVKTLRAQVLPLRQRERKQLATVIEIRGCDKCDLCEDHA